MSKQHLVKCFVCKEVFDCCKIQAVKHSSTRYSHATCEPDNKDFVPLVEPSAEEKDLEALNDYISTKYGDKANYTLIKRQIKRFTKEKGYSLSGILKSLIWFYDVKGNSVEDSNGGIGIVEYVYQDSYNYYLGLFLAQEANKNRKVFSVINEVEIKPPTLRGTKQKLIDLEAFVE